MKHIVLNLIFIVLAYLALRPVEKVQRLARALISMRALT